MAKPPKQVARGDEPETHDERCVRELLEQEAILARVREDSDRFDAAVKADSPSEGPETNGEPS